MNNKILLSTICILAVLSSCAKHPDKIAPQYISPMQYRNYTCDQIAAEVTRLSTRVSELHGVQKKAHTTSNVATVVGVVLFWPALFFIDGNSQGASEYTRLKGEFNALEQIAIEKNCNLQIKK